MENLKPVDLEQKVETRFCAWHKQNKRLFYLELFFGNYTESIIKVRSYPHSGNSIITLNRNEVLIIPYSDNYVVRDGVLYEKSADKSKAVYIVAKSLADIIDRLSSSQQTTQQ